MGDGARGAPAPTKKVGSMRGAAPPPALWGGMTRTDNKPLFRSTNPTRSGLLEARAQAMRSSLTPSEQLLWARIRGRRLGVAFRRQVPLLGRFIADFLAPAERLVIELDGGHHAEQARA